MIHRHVTEALRSRALNYVLGFLPAEEATAMEVHLRTGCAVCEREVRANRYLVDLLAMQQGAGKPPPALRERLLGLIATEVRTSSRSGQNPDAGSPSIAAGWTIVRSAEEGWRPSEGREACVKPLSQDPARGSHLALIRLGPQGLYPGFRAAGTMELYVLEGNLIVNGEHLGHGDYCAAPAGTVLRDMESRHGCRYILLRSEHEGARDADNPAISSNVTIVRASEGTWLPTPVQGITMKLLFTEPARGTQTYLVRALPGSRMRRIAIAAPTRRSFSKEMGGWGPWCLKREIIIMRPPGRSTKLLGLSTDVSVSRLRRAPMHRNERSDTWTW
ncbi:MAG TPA: hypothetical protein VHF07_02050 [Nitrospiraceae bacterium]|nr:hypothetical protein [Nitrospiraceae bacterium]